MNVNVNSKMQWIILILFVFSFIGSIKCNCKVVINEINLVDSKNPKETDYIELKQTCSAGDRMSLKGYKLIGFSCKSNSGIIDIVGTLWNFRMNKTGFFTIGGSKIENTDVKIPNVMIKSASSFSKVKMNSLSTNFLTISNTEVRAIGLLFDEGNFFKDIVLQEKKQFLPIKEKITDTLQKYLVDLVVYAGKVPCNKCEFIEKIHSDFFERKYVLRDMQFNLDNNEVTLNRCTIENTGFGPEMFKPGKPTPGAQNDCKGPYFILEDNILEATGPLNDHFTYPDDIDIDHEFENSCESQSQPTCTSSILPSDYSQTSSYSIAKTVHQLNVSSTTNTCTDLMLSPDAAHVSTILDQENRRKRKIGIDTDYSEENEWSTTKYFR